MLLEAGAEPFRCSELNPRPWMVDQKCSEGSQEVESGLAGKQE